MTREQVVFQFSGVRPLPVAKGSTGQISRDHSIEIQDQSEDNPWPIFSLVGGKWTSYRAFSEQVTDRVLEMLARPRLTGTSRLAIGGGKGYPTSEKEQLALISKIASQTGLTENRVTELFSRYGSRASEIASFISSHNDFPSTHLDYSSAEIRFLAEHEHIAHIDDFLLRRTKLAWTGQVSREMISELAQIMGDILGWSDQDQQQEIERCLTILTSQHAMKL